MDISNFYSLLEVLKSTKRQGWLDRKLDADTIGSHIFGAVAIGWYLAFQEKVDVSRVIEMLVLHDLVMAKMDDVTPASGKYADKRKLEEDTKGLVKEILPASLQGKYVELFDEFNVQKTLESQVARQADKLETLLQGEVFEIKTGKTDILDEFLVTYANIFRDGVGKEIFDEIKKRHEERKK